MTAETITPNDDVTALSDRALLERVCRQLDHLDIMLHDHDRKHDELAAQLAPLVPHIPRALALLDPGSFMRRGKRGKSGE